MNITKEVITDLFPLYAANECSADTRALVEDYLRQHPREANELRRALDTALPGTAPAKQRLDEMESLRRARRLLRRQSWVLGLAIFFSLAPFSMLHTGGKLYWLFLESPLSALGFGTGAVVCWIIYATLRGRAKVL